MGGLEQFVQNATAPETTGSAPLLNQHWNLKPEAFQLRHDHSAGDNFDGAENAEEEPTLRAVTIEDQPSHLVNLEDVPEIPTWSPNQTLIDTLNFYADTGDIQSTIAMYMVIGHDRLKDLIDEGTVEYWFTTYVEMLQRFRLFNQATEMIQICPIENIRIMNLQSTNYLSNCAACKKALMRREGGHYCDRCKKFSTICSLCFKTVKGLYVWCQGCGHGGHLSHLKAWFEETGNKNCPAGCGHLCEYN